MNTINDLLEKGMGDWSVVALQWIDDHDFAIDMIPPGSKKKVRLLFIWVRCMNINFNFGSYSGMPLTYGMTCQRSPTGFDIDIVFGGQPDGRLSFQCNDLLIDDGHCKNDR